MRKERREGEQEFSVNSTSFKQINKAKQSKMLPFFQTLEAHTAVCFQREWDRLYGISRSNTAAFSADRF